MEGHYHASFEGDDGQEIDINEPDLEKFLAQVRAVPESAGLTDYGFVCQYGCGQLHLLNKDEQAKITEALQSRTCKHKYVHGQCATCGHIA